MNDTLPKEASEGFRITAELLQQALSHDRRAVAVIASVRERVSRLEKEVERLTVVLERGDGRPSWRQDLDALRLELDQLKEWRVTVRAARSEAVKGQWQLAAVLVTAISGLLLGVLNLVFQ